MQQMIGLDEALKIVLQHAPPLSSESVAHAAALHRTLAQDVAAPLDLPPFDNSAMDGYALRSAETRDSSSENPLALRVCGLVAAGGATLLVEAGTCAKIMTGAPLPRGADAVVMREEVREENGVAFFSEAVESGACVRRAGSDVRRGETVLRRGDKIDAAAWGMLASFGADSIEVMRRPRVGLIVTGDELTTHNETLTGGQIRDSNSFTLRAMIEDCGAICEYSRTVRDDEETLRATFAEAAQSCDFLVTSGGVSAGDFDLVRDVTLADAQVHFWKMRLKPGKPAMFATQNFGGKTLPILALPGNPVSVMVVFELLARPALLQMQARRTLHRAQVAVRVTNGFSSPRGKTEMVRARVFADESGALVASSCGDQGSGRLSSMLGANALLIVPEDVTEVADGDILRASLTGDFAAL